MQSRSNHARRSPLAPLIAVFLAVSAMASAPEGPAGWKQVYEHWYSLEIAGATAGWMRQTLLDDGGQYRLEAETRFSIDRAGVTIEAATFTSSLETHHGEMVKVDYRQTMGQMEVQSVWTFHDDHVQLESSQGGRKLQRKLDRPAGEWLSPMAAERYWLERCEAGADEITFSTINAETGLSPVTISYVRQGRQQYDFNGRSLPVTVWNVTSSALAGVKSIEKVSADGHQVYQEMTTGIGPVVTRITTRELAIAAARNPPPELMISTFVKLDQPIETAVQARSIKLRLKTRDGRLPEIPSAGAQKVTIEEGGESAVLTINIDRPLQAADGDSENQDFRQASTMVDCDDPLIRKLAERALRDAGPSDVERVEALRAFAHNHITGKSLDTAFATASETARVKSGDCSEHGVLLCALLRASGIPARVASGLLYMDSYLGQSAVYGWHMWTQALVDGRWIDLDATQPIPYHAGHVLTGVSSLADGVGDSNLAAMMALIGNLDIEVIEVGYGSDD